MHITLKLHGLGPQSINSAYYADKRHGFKPDVKIWLSQIAHQMQQSPNLEAVKTVKQFFNPDLHVFHVEMIISTPNLLTTAGRISSKSVDCSNFEKLILDAIFLPAHSGSLQIDDKYVTRLISEKRLGELSIEINIAIKLLDSVEAKLE